MYEDDEGYFDEAEYLGYSTNLDTSGLDSSGNQNVRSGLNSAADGGAQQFDQVDIEGGILDDSALHGTDEYGDNYHVYFSGSSEIWVYDNGSSWDQTNGIFTDTDGKQYDADSNFLGQIDPTTGAPVGGPKSDSISGYADGGYDQGPLDAGKINRQTKMPAPQGAGQGPGGLSFGAGGGGSSTDKQTTTGTNQPPPSLLNKIAKTITSTGKIFDEAGKLIGITNVKGPNGSGTGGPVKIGIGNPATMPGSRPGQINSVPGGSVQHAVPYKPTGLAAIGDLPASTLLIAAAVVVGLVLLTQRASPTA
jgi:hypothetical protein